MVKRERTLVEIRCPHTRISKSDGKTYPCKKLAVKVYSGSSGEAYCNKCKKAFIFSLHKTVEQGKE